MIERIASRDAALQHGRAPRPLPLFLELVRETARAEPVTARQALDGLTLYEQARRASGPAPRPEVARVGGATLRDHGGQGQTVVLVPSLINPPSILDLPGRSLAQALAAQHHVLLVDWGKAEGRSELDISSHVDTILAPLLRSLPQPASLVGYCLGGTMALAAANLVPVKGVATLAAPWNFDAYPAESLKALAALWRQVEPAARRLGMLPMEVLQAAFWSIDRYRVVAKFAALAARPADATAIDRFVALEDWANDGEPLPFPAAAELIETLFFANATGEGRWRVAGTVNRPDPVPALHFAARGDRIVPEASAPPGEIRSVAAGHVGMIIGSKAEASLHGPLLEFLAAGPRPRLPE